MKRFAWLLVLPVLISTSPTDGLYPTMIIDSMSKMVCGDNSFQMLLLEKAEEKYGLRFDNDLILKFGDDKFTFNPVEIQILRELQRRK